MKTKAILFDKDGTLIDFDSVWVTVSSYAISYILKEINMPQIPKIELLECLGIYDGTASIDGVLAQYPYDIMSEHINKVLCKHGCSIDSGRLCEITQKAYIDNLDKGIVKLACQDEYAVLDLLRSKGIMLFVVTNDYYNAALGTLDKAGISDCFDGIYSPDQNYKHKPDRQMIDALLNKYNLKNNEVVMVGDTLADMEFAINGNIKGIGVAKNERNRNILLTKTNTVIKDISELVSIID